MLCQIIKPLVIGLFLCRLSKHFSLRKTFCHHLCCIEVLAKKKIYIRIPLQIVTETKYLYLWMNWNKWKILFLILQLPLTWLFQNKVLLCCKTIDCSICYFPSLNYWICIKHEKKFFGQTWKCTRSCNHEAVKAQQRHTGVPYCSGSQPFLVQVR